MPGIRDYVRRILRRPRHQEDEENANNPLGGAGHRRGPGPGPGPRGGGRGPGGAGGAGAGAGAGGRGRGAGGRGAGAGGRGAGGRGRGRGAGDAAEAHLLEPMQLERPHADTPRHAPLHHRHDEDFPGRRFASRSPSPEQGRKKQKRECIQYINVVLSASLEAQRQRGAQSSQLDQMRVIVEEKEPTESDLEELSKPEKLIFSDKDRTSSAGQLSDPNQNLSSASERTQHIVGKIKSMSVEPPIDDPARSVSQQSSFRRLPGEIQELEGTPMPLGKLNLLLEEVSPHFGQRDAEGSSVIGKRSRPG